ncbi:hypothetical protein DFA_06415 [Cavenderia fasciculata]|uniref:Uncharacterized protein n=1 Tax=Cavenderia fasciculata TaxID=261658 RepID=F4PIX9_CACFS|nr:uncharacterized protein DFA_06415 [Cavenderia fasciculata]EGG24265.1 hypothetical protein DFA_06415 [Cavenderia fasciculata]|eukprot:XP_004362116.1 hypothetical protein DFA_06415 [Cavenderia fasciculata]
MNYTNTHNPTPQHQHKHQQQQQKEQKQTFEKLIHYLKTEKNNQDDDDDGIDEEEDDCYVVIEEKQRMMRVLPSSSSSSSLVTTPRSLDTSIDFSSPTSSVSSSASSSSNLLLHKNSSNKLLYHHYSSSLPTTPSCTTTNSNTLVSPTNSSISSSTTPSTTPSIQLQNNHTTTLTHPHAHVDEQHDYGTISCSPPSSSQSTIIQLTIKQQTQSSQQQQQQQQCSGEEIVSSMSSCSILSALSCTSTSTTSHYREELNTLLEGPWHGILDGLPLTLRDHIKVSYIRLHSSMYDITRQVAMYLELQETMTKMSTMLVSDLNSTQYSHYTFGIEDYVTSVVANNHLLWNSAHYMTNWMGFANDLDAISAFYKCLVNDLVFQLFFTPFMSSRVKKVRSIYRATHDEMAYRVYSAVTIESAIRQLTEMKTLFEMLETQHAAYCTMHAGNLQPPPFSLLGLFTTILSNSSAYLGHYRTAFGGDLRSYQTGTMLQRFTLNGISNFTRRLRLAIYEDPIFQTILDYNNQEYLLLWMMACSNNSQQYYLNTCNPSAFNLSFISKSPNISPLLTVLNEIIKKLEIYKRVSIIRRKDIKAYKTLLNVAPTVQQYMDKKVDKVKSLYESIYNDCLQFSNQLKLNQTTTTGNNNISNKELINSIFKLTNRWNEAMQSLSSIFSPSTPRILTKKPIASSWHASAYLMTAYCVATFFIPSPKMFDRISGTPPFFFETMMLINFDYCFPKSSRYYRIYEDYQSDFAQITDPVERLESLNRLWDDCFNLGGVLFCSSEKIFRQPIGHLNYLFAIQMNATRLFLVGDPEIKNFKVYNLQDMTDIILQDTFFFASSRAD